MDDSFDDDRVRRLDAYLATLHAGDSPDHAAFADVAPFLDCLDGLEDLARHSNLDDGATEPRVSPSGDPAVDPWATRAVGKYELLEEVGRGGMGVVFKARQTDPERIVALKMILVNHLASPDHVRRFQAEIRAAARLQHPNVVPLFETGEWNGLPFFSMQYVAGTSLAAVLERGPLEPEVAARLLAAVARAVAYLHGAGVIHRDLKPGNILLDGEGRPYVTDFGLAKLLEGGEAQTATGAVLGTAAYMAPEHALGHSTHVTPASDVYGLGGWLRDAHGAGAVQRRDGGSTHWSRCWNATRRRRDSYEAIPATLETICLRLLGEAAAGTLSRRAGGRGGSGALPARGGYREPGGQCRPECEALGAAGAGAAAAAGGDRLVRGDCAGELPERRVGVTFHLQTLAILASWGAVSWLCQRMLNRGVAAVLVGVVWSACDVLLLTLLIWSNDKLASP
ncbi:MAG: serine/threonine-protein kinase [Gemmataceae bacterium]